MHFQVTVWDAVSHRAAGRRSQPTPRAPRAAALTAALFLLAPSLTPAHAFTVERVSVDSAGGQGNGGSTTSAISADGRFVAFASTANNLVANDTNQVADIFVRDRLTGATERVSVSSEGLQAAGQSATPAMSADGRYVAFASAAGDLVPGDTNGRFDVFVHDRASATTERVSVASDGTAGASDSVSPAISADGRFVAFASAASNLTVGDTNAAFDVFVRDRLAATTTRVSVASDGSEGNGFSLAPRISGDGSVVVFQSFATNLVANDANRVADVFAREIMTGVTTRVSQASDGTAGNGQSAGAQISADGRIVAFDSDSSTFVSSDTNGRTDVFVHDRATGVTERVSIATDGREGNNSSGFVDPPALSADGRYVAFMTTASDLVPGDSNGFVDVMLRDRLAGVTSRVHVAVGGAQANGGTTVWANLSGDGRVVSFASAASNLVPGDTNAVTDVFLWVDTCGDGGLDVGESCDDSNRADGDCCSAACTLEAAGSACDDGDLCTRNDACDALGVCVGSDTVVCQGGAGQCGTPAACDPATGACAAGIAPDGTVCDDGDACTAGDVCIAGTCEPGELDPASCLSSFQCYSAVGWKRPPWWFSSGTVLVEDLFESALYHLGATSAVCSAIAPPPGQIATRQACVQLRRAGDGRSREREVLVRNALGEQLLEVRKERQLCVLASGSEAPAAAGLDSFKCYAAELADADHAGSPPVTLTLEDEFGSRRVSVKRPEMLCNPASVAEGDVLHERAHLVCYRILEKWLWSHGGSFRPRTLKLSGIFGDEPVTILRRDYLCLPSLLLDF